MEAKRDAGVGGAGLCDECANFRAPGISPRASAAPWALAGLSTGLAQAQLWEAQGLPPAPSGWGLGPSLGARGGERVTLVAHRWYIPGGAGQTRPDSLGLQVQERD